jgi:hypothetical protein
MVYHIGEEQFAPGVDPIRTCSTQVELLKTAYKREGLEKPPQSYYDLFNALDKRFNGNKAWTDAKPQLEKYTPGLKAGETFGCWKAPSKFEWEFEQNETQAERGWREGLSTRRVSGNSWANGNANGNVVEDGKKYTAVQEKAANEAAKESEVD